jgi:hypothetical protein
MKHQNKGLLRYYWKIVKDCGPFYRIYLFILILLRRDESVAYNMYMADKEEPL